MEIHASGNYIIYCITFYFLIFTLLLINLFQNNRLVRAIWELVAVAVITEDIVARAKRPSVHNVFPYFFDGTDIEDYNQAQFIEQKIIVSQSESG